MIGIDAITKDKETEAISNEACGAAREIISIVQEEVIKIRTQADRRIDGKNLNQLALALKNAHEVAHKAIETRQPKRQQRELEFIVRYQS